MIEYGADFTTSIGSDSASFVQVFRSKLADVMDNTTEPLLIVAPATSRRRTVGNILVSVQFIDPDLQQTLVGLACVDWTLTFGGLELAAVVTASGTLCPSPAPTSFRPTTAPSSNPSTLSQTSPPTTTSAPSTTPTSPPTVLMLDNPASAESDDTSATTSQSALVTVIILVILSCLFVGIVVRRRQRAAVWSRAKKEQEVASDPNLPGEGMLSNPLHQDVDRLSSPAATWARGQSYAPPHTGGDTDDIETPNHEYAKVHDYAAVSDGRIIPNPVYQPSTAQTARATAGSEFTRGSAMITNPVYQGITRGHIVITNPVYQGKQSSVQSYSPPNIRKVPSNMGDVAVGV